MPQPKRIVPLYLASLAWQFVHFAEEFFTGLQTRWLIEILHAKPSENQNFVSDWMTESC